MDRLTIAGKTYRVECNFNAILAYMDLRGEKDMSFLSGELGLREWLDMMTAAINEGERLDGKEHSHTSEEFGEILMLDMATVIQEFIAIFGKQNAIEGDSSKKKE